MTKRQLALGLAAICLMIWGLLAASSLWWGLCPFCILIFMWKRSSHPPFRMDIIDMAVCLIAFAEVILFFCSPYQANSLAFPLIFLSFALFWLFLRNRIYSPAVQDLLLFVLTAIGGMLAILTLFFFLFYWVKVTDMGFGDITRFRFLYRPFGMLSNDWTGVMLALLPFSAAAWHKAIKPYSWLCGAACLLMALSVIVALSRGAVLALLFMGVMAFTVLLYYRVYPKKRLFSGAAGFIALIALACIPVRAPLQTTFAMTENLSQVRSIEGRINRWNDSRSLFRQHPLTGAGAGNYALASESLSNRRESIYTSRSTNSWLQLAAEKGICGVVCYGLFFAVWLLRILQTLGKRNATDAGAMLCAAGVL
ncbi:MAG: O-antigen ligase family protein, partial [Bacteroidales bacterium]|nr:O-antigen ligase family protein [Bacteroidales bacterium]